MQTVSLMSGTSQPIPAHFVHMRSRHSLKQKVRNSMSHRANQPSPQRIHDSFLFVPGVVPTELLDLRGGEVVEAKGIHPLLGQLRYNSKWLKLRILSFPYFYWLPRMFAHNNAEDCIFGSDQRQIAKKYFFFVHLILFSSKTKEKEGQTRELKWELRIQCNRECKLQQSTASSSSCWSWT